MKNRSTSHHSVVILTKFLFYFNSISQKNERNAVFTGIFARLFGLFVKIEKKAIKKAPGAYEVNPLCWTILS